MKILDSSVVLAFVNVDDALHSKAALLDLPDGVLNELVFSEVANVLQKRVKDSVLVMKIIRQLKEDVEILWLLEDELRESINFFERHYPKISLTDASLAVQAKKYSSEVLTFDEELKKVLS